MSQTPEKPAGSPPGLLRRRPVALLLWAAALLALGLWFALPRGEPPVSSIGGPFALIDQNGQPRTQADLLGHYSLIYFGYSFCPDVCPLDLAAMSRGLEDFEAKAPARGAKVLPVFITVDPARDTPDKLRAYAAAFHPRLLALTGSEASAKAARDAWHVYAARAPGGGADYLVDHQAFIFLMDPKAQYLAHLGSNPAPAAITVLLDEKVR